MSMDLFGIKWLDESKGYTDILRYSDFANEGTTEEFTHDVLGPKYRREQAKCLLMVHDTEAHLDYEALPKFNNEQGMCIGIIRLLFPTSKRDKWPQVFWKNQGRKRYTRGKCDVINPLPARPQYKLGKGESQKALRKIKERPGQSRFRSNLMMTYDGKCCISGCFIRDVLEGAHIDPFSGTSSDNPQNGLLLRRDLHALFDANLLAIDPNTRLVHIAASAQSWPEYKGLHKVACLAEPKYGGASYLPSDEALKRRWLAFIKIHENSKLAHTKTN